MKLAEAVGIEEQHKSPGALRLGIAAGIPLLAGGVFFLYRKLRQEVPPPPAWDAELKRPPFDASLVRDEYRPAGDGPQKPATELSRHVESLPPKVPLNSVESAEAELPPDRVEYRNEFGEKAVGLPGDGLDAVPATPVDETELVTRFGKLIGMPMTDLMDSPMGSIEAVYYRRLRGEPEWAVTSHGMVDRRHVLVPLDGAVIGDSVRLSVPKSMIDEAPTVDIAPVLEDELEKGLYAHYMVRRMLPGLEGERDEQGLRLRLWAPVATELGESTQTRDSG
jgi:hypothetical protein